MKQQADIWRFCINRNIMECKDSMSKLFETLNDSINRNIMECKAGWARMHMAIAAVLIETLWNVKTIRQAIYRGENMY